MKMNKLFKVIVLTVAMVACLCLLLTSCGECQHTGGVATCNAKAKCTACQQEYGELAAHTFAEATCTAPKTCTVCAVTEGNALGHTGGTATCTAKATCTRCNTQYGEVLPHDYAEATCTAPKTCKACSATDGEALGHDEQYEVIAPTCVAGGITNITCSRCDYTNTKDPTEATGVHVYDVKGETVAPTCVDKGYTTYSCSAGECGTTENKDFVDELGHDEKYEVIAPTCVAGGITNVTCSRCDYTNTKDPTEATGVHVYDVKGETTAPTCLEQGYTTYSCSAGECGTTENKDFVDALGHAEKYEVIPATCLTDGITNVTCSRCDYTATKDPVTALGHTGGTATCITQKVCVREGCGMSYGELLPHKYDVVVETVAPTCITKGYTEYSCSAGECGTTEKRDETNEIPHNYNVKVETVAPTCITKGYTEYSCSAGECDTTEKRDETNEIPHNYNVKVETVAPTCITKGYTEYSCSAGECGTTEKRDETNEVEHVYDVKGETVAPSCSAEGYTTYGCSQGECGLTENRDYTKRIAHTFVDVNEFDEIICSECQQSYRNVTTLVSTGDGELCLGCDRGENGECVCNVKVEWNGYVAPLDPDKLTANEEFTKTKVFENKDLEIGEGLIKLTSESEANYTVTIGEQTIEVSGTEVVIDLYEYESVTSVTIVSDADAEVVFYEKIN